MLRVKKRQRDELTALNSCRPAVKFSVIGLETHEK